MEVTPENTRLICENLRAETTPRNSRAEYIELMQRRIDELEAHAVTVNEIIRGLVDAQPVDDESSACVFCGGDIIEYDGRGEIAKINHADDCLWKKSSILSLPHNDQTPLAPPAAHPSGSYTIIGGPAETGGTDAPRFVPTCQHDVVLGGVCQACWKRVE